MNGAVLIARCRNTDEPSGVRCEGRLEFQWGWVFAACDTCGGCCGIAVADWIEVER